MKFLVDAQLPRQLCAWLSQQGEDVLHTLDLPNGNRTSDREITAIAKAQDRIVVSKDSDFVQSFFVTGQPALLLLSTGNINNTQLEDLFKLNLPRILFAFENHRFIEITRSEMIIHE